MTSTTNHAEYQIVLLPTLRVVAACGTLAEAAAWIETYNYVMSGSGRRAVIDQIGIGLSAGRSLRKCA